MAVHSDEAGRSILATDQRKQAQEIEKHIEGMKLILQKLTREKKDSDKRA